MDEYHTYLTNKIYEYRELYSLRNGITKYQNTYLQDVPTYHGFRNNTTFFQRKLDEELEKCSLTIRKYLVSNEEYNYQIKKIHKELKCGFVQYLFRSNYKGNYKNATLFKDKYLPDNIHSHIIQFLDTRDMLSIKFHSIYKDRNTVETLLKSMTLSSLKKLPHIFDAHHYYNSYGRTESKNPLKKIAKSVTKNNLISTFLDNLDSLYQHFKGYNVTLQTLQQKYSINMTYELNWAYDCICMSDKYSIYFDPYYISYRYMIACSKALLTLYIYSNHKASQKKAKKRTKSKKKPISQQILS